MIGGLQRFDKVGLSAGPGNGAGGILGTLSRFRDEQKAPLDLVEVLMVHLVDRSAAVGCVCAETVPGQRQVIAWLEHY